MSAPATLAYDDLPAGSDIRRDYDGDFVQITIPAGEPPPAAIKQGAYDALASGTTSSWALLLLAFVLFYFGVRTNRVSGASLLWAWIFFAVFCAALVMLVVWIRYGMILDALRAGRLQATVIAASPQRLLIETAGPFGTVSYDIASETIRDVRSGRGMMRDDRQRPLRLTHLTLSLTDGRTILLLPAREVRELQYIAAGLRRTLSLPPQ